MFEALALLGGSGAAGLASLAWVRVRQVHLANSDAQAFELRFPQELDGRQIEVFLDALGGLLRPWWRRTLGAFPAVTFEIVASRAGGVQHRLIVPGNVESFVAAQLASAVPALTLVRLDSATLPPVKRAAELGITNHRRPLRVDQPEAVARTLLAALSPLGTGETVIIQWVVTPHPPVGPVRSPQRPVAGLKLPAELASVIPDSEAIRAARAKQERRLFLAVGRIGVTASTIAAEQALVRRVLGSLHVVNAPGVHLRRRSLPSGVAAKRLARRTVPAFEFPLTLNAAEVAALVAWAIGAGDIRGVTRHARSFAASPIIASAGRVIGHATHGSDRRDLALTVADSLLHMVVAGPTGVGKSTLLAGLVAQDIAAGRSVVLIDPKGDLVGDVLDRVPEERVGDVVVFDPSDERPVGFNPLDGAERQPELVADQVLGVMHRLWKDSWGPRSSDILHSALLTVCRQPDASLLDLGLILTNDAARRRMVAPLEDPILAGFWASFDAMNPGERAAAIAAPMNKLRQLTLRSSLRAILASPSTVQLDALINRGKVLLVSLPVGLVGDEAAALVANLLVARLWQNIQARSAVAADRRRVVMVYIDELPVVAPAVADLGGALAQARGLGAAFVMALQSPSQVSGEIRAAISANARSKVSFQAAAGDAATIAGDLGPSVDARDVIGLPAFEFIATLAASGQVAPPASGRTYPLSRPTGNGQRVRAASREQFGRDRSVVEANIRARYDGTAPDGPTLRRRRGAS